MSVLLDTLSGSELDYIRPAHLLDNGQLCTYGPLGKVVIARIANGLVLFWDRKVRCEYVGGWAVVENGFLTITIQLHLSRVDN